MADQIKTRGSTRIKKAELAGATYRGSARTAQFNPVQAVNTDKVEKQRKQQLTERLDAQSRELGREQTAANLSLKARQQSTTGLLKIEQQKESDALKATITREEGQFAIDKSVALGNAALNVAGVAAQGQMKAARTKLIGDIAQLSISFAGKYYDVKTKIDAARSSALAQFAKPVFEGGAVDGAEAGAVEDKNFNESVVTSEKAIQKVTGNDESLASTLRADNIEAIRSKDARRGAINTAGQNIGGYMRDFMNSSTEMIDTPWGKMSPMQASTGEQIDWMLQYGLHKWGVENNVGMMIEKDPLQVQSSIIPQAKSIYQQLSSGLGQQVIKNQQDQAKNDAYEAANSDLTSKKDAGQVVQDLRARLLASGAYRGKEGAASDDAFNTVVKYAVATRDTDVIDQLEASEKIEGNKGLAWKKIKEAELLKARADIRDGIIEDGNRSIKEARIAKSEIMQDRLKALDKENITNEEERAINLETITKLEALGDYEASAEATKLRNKGLNYNPLTFSELKAQQIDPENPRLFTNDELHALYDNQDISLSEAKELGYQPIKGRSTDQVAAAKLKDWKIDTSATAKGIVLGIIKQSEENKDVAAEVAKTQGVNIANDIERRLNADMYTWLRQNPNATPTEAAEYLQELSNLYTDKIGGSITYDTKKNRIENYDFGGNKNYPGSSIAAHVLPDELTRSDGVFYRDFSNHTPADLKTLGLTTCNPTKQQILTDGPGGELDLAWRAMNGEEGINIPRSVSLKADALGISVTDLIIMQAQFHPGSIYDGASTLPVGGLPTQTKE